MPSPREVSIQHLKTSLEPWCSKLNPGDGSERMPAWSADHASNSLSLKGAYPNPVITLTWIMETMLAEAFRQIYAHGLHGYVGVSALVAPLIIYNYFSQWHSPSGATRGLAPTYPCSPRAQTCQHDFCQHGLSGPLFLLLPLLTITITVTDTMNVTVTITVTVTIASTITIATTMTMTMTITIAITITIIIIIVLLLLLWDNDSKVNSNLNSRVIV